MILSTNSYIVNDMKAFIQTDENHEFYNVNAYLAFVGFTALGFEVIKYVDSCNIKSLDKEDVFVGGVGMIRKRLKSLNIEIPDEIEYPLELQPFLNRKVWTTTLNELIEGEVVGIFIKPVKTKLFQGKVINSFSDYIGLNYQENIEVWCSESINVITEWRCFVRYGQILDVRYYKGKWDSQLDLKIIEDAISKYKSASAAYCLDFGVDEQGNHYLIEVNDGHSLGSYGMGAISYAKFLSARWAEMTNTKDYLNF